MFILFIFAGDETQGFMHGLYWCATSLAPPHPILCMYVCVDLDIYKYLGLVLQLEEGFALMLYVFLCNTVFIFILFIFKSVKFWGRLVFTGQKSGT